MGSWAYLVRPECEQENWVAVLRSTWWYVSGITCHMLQKHNHSEQVSWEGVLPWKQLHTGAKESLGLIGHRALLLFPKQAIQMKGWREPATILVHSSIAFILAPFAAFITTNRHAARCYIWQAQREIWEAHCRWSNSQFDKHRYCSSSSLDLSCFLVPLFQTMQTAFVGPKASTNLESVAGS